MAPHRVHIPVPMDLIDDLEIAVVWAEARLPEARDARQREAVQDARTALQGLRGNISSVRAHRAEVPLPVPVTLMNRGALETLARLIQNPSGGAAHEREAIEKVSKWLRAA